MQEKELLRKLGEETIYSAKGHFKACDLRRQLVTYTIWGCVALNILGVWGISPSIDKALALIVYSAQLHYYFGTKAKAKITEPSTRKQPKSIWHCIKK
jgi:phosphate/sulfate permease